MKNRMENFAIITVIATVFGAAPLNVQKLQAVTIPVTSRLDDGSPGTLREAIANASDGDAIDASGISGTIFLANGELLVNKSVTILGPGPDLLAVDGNHISRVFHIAPGKTVTVSGF